MAPNGPCFVAENSSPKAQHNLRLPLFDAMKLDLASPIAQTFGGPKPLCL